MQFATNRMRLVDFINRSLYDCTVYSVHDHTVNEINYNFYFVCTVAMHRMELVNRNIS